jgi:hypothetical protein
MDTQGVRAQIALPGTIARTNSDTAKSGDQNARETKYQSAAFVAAICGLLCGILIYSYSVYVNCC